MIFTTYGINFLSCCFTAIPPRVTEEADRMMRKLRDLQSQVDERASDVARKESQLHMLEAEKESAIKRLRDAEGEMIMFCLLANCKAYMYLYKVTGLIVDLRS